MKKVLVSLAVVMMGSFVMMPNVDAQGRRGGRESSRSSQRVVTSRSNSNNDKKATRPGSSSVGSGSSRRPGSSSIGFGSNQRPGSSTVRPGQGSNSNKPGNDYSGKPGSSSNNGIRPPKPGNDNGKKPGGQSGVAPKPGGGSNHGYKPDKPGGGPNHGPAPKPGHNPGYKPGKGPRPIVVAPPPRPGRPIYSAPWTRPVPPGHWRPVNHDYLVANVLGMTFGVAINTALDYLWYEGYVIDGYGANDVYLRNVYELGYYWDEATMYFDRNGLSRSQFYDSTSYYDTSRYNNVYNSLCSKYGRPVSRSGMSTTWFGYHGDYITLEYTNMNSSSGYRYFTILTYGH